MPPFKPVSSLESLTLETLAHLLKRLCYAGAVTVEDMKPMIEHFKLHLPPQIQAAICYTLLHDSNKIVFPELLKQKYLMLCTNLHASYLWISYNKNIVPVMHEMDGKSVRTLKMTTAYEQEDFYLEREDCYGQFAKFEPLYDFFQTLTNLTTLKCTRLCNNKLLRIISKKCPHLQDISIEMCTEVDDEGIFYLAGHIPTVDTNAMIKRGVKIPSESVCTKLRKVNFEYTLARAASGVMLLYFCPNIEELYISPDVNIGDIFTTLHGTNPDKYEMISARYSLKVLHVSKELQEDELSLIVRTCPKLEDVMLRCNGVERKDRNFLANLLSLNLKSLNLMNCSMQALLWYLEQKGESLSSLTILHLTMAPVSLTFTRSHLQTVILTCPNLLKFTLKLCNRPIQPDVPYACFGRKLCYFKSLSYLMIEGATITAEDLVVLVSHCKVLRELHILIHNLEVLDDDVLYRLLSTGCLRNLWTLYLYNPMLTLAALHRLIDECPQLQSIGPLSSWSISKNDRIMLSNEIRTKNWDLNVDTLDREFLRRL